MSRLSPALLVACSLGLAACAGSLTREELYDPASCGECHQEHLDQWRSSMHAYAADDPVFLAMNRRGQEETNGELGSFCVNCHAPLAVRLGLVEDGLELEDPDLPQHLKGVSCAFCHLAAHADGDSNNPIELDPRDVLKGSIGDPVKSPAHRSEYSPLLDRSKRESAQLCGSCHDIVLANGVHLEQTFAEWKETVFADDQTLTTCGNCHMFRVGPPDARENRNPRPIATYDGVPARDFHDHRMAAIDVAVTPWFGEEDQAEQVQSLLKSTLRSQICVNPLPGGFQLVVGLENVSAGHSFPSGASQDRRVWAHLQATDAQGVIWERGLVPDGVPAVDVPQGILLRDRLTGDAGQEVHMFWEVEEIERNVLDGTAQFGLEETRVWSFEDVQGRQPQAVTLTIHARPMGLDVIDDLIGSGHLDAEIREAIPTFQLTNAALTWSGVLGSCVSSDGQ